MNQEEKEAAIAALGTEITDSSGIPWGRQAATELRQLGPQHLLVIYRGITYRDPKSGRRLSDPKPYGWRVQVRRVVPGGGTCRVVPSVNGSRDTWAKKKADAIKKARKLLREKWEAMPAQIDRLEELHEEIGGFIHEKW